MTNKLNKENIVKEVKKVNSGYASYVKVMNKSVSRPSALLPSRAEFIEVRHFISYKYITFENDEVMLVLNEQPGSPQRTQALNRADRDFDYVYRDTFAHLKSLIGNKKLEEHPLKYTELKKTEGGHKVLSANPL